VCFDFIDSVHQISLQTARHMVSDWVNGHATKDNYLLHTFVM